MVFTLSTMVTETSDIVSTERGTNWMIYFRAQLTALSLWQSFRSNKSMHLCRCHGWYLTSSAWIVCAAATQYSVILLLCSKEKGERREISIYFRFFCYSFKCKLEQQNWRASVVVSLLPNPWFHNQLTQTVSNQNWLNLTKCILICRSAVFSKILTQCEKRKYKVSSNPKQRRRRPVFSSNWVVPLTLLWTFL